MNEIMIEYNTLFFHIEDLFINSPNGKKNKYT